MNVNSGISEEGKEGGVLLVRSEEVRREECPFGNREQLAMRNEQLAISSEDWCLKAESGPGVIHSSLLTTNYSLFTIHLF